MNTTDSRVELSWDVAVSAALDGAERDRVLARLSSRLRDGVLTVVAEEHRSQLRNRRAARDRLEAVLAEALRPRRARRPTRPTAGSRRRRADAKRQRSETKRLRRRPE